MSSEQTLDALPHCSTPTQVPKQQQNQHAGAWSIGPPGFQPADPEAESEPHQPDPRQNLPAAQAHSAVSTADTLIIPRRVDEGVLSRPALRCAGRPC